MQKLFRVIGLLLGLSAALPARAATVEDVIKNVRNLAPAQRRAALEEGAKKEGEVIWYTSMSLTDFPKVVGAFEKIYPAVKIRANRLAQPHPRAVRPRCRRGKKHTKRRRRSASKRRRSGTPRIRSACC